MAPGEDPTPCDALWGQDRPILAGFNYFEGILYNQQPPGLNYSNYRRTKVSAATPCATITNEVVTTYMTDDIADAAAAWIGNVQQGVPWFAYVAFTAAHKPFHCPPENLGDPYDGHNFPCTGQPGEESIIQYRSMIEALDIDFGDLLLAMKARDTDLEHTLVIIVSDNGSPSEVAELPFEGDPVKGTVGQGGIWVPLIIGGDGLQHDVIPNGHPVGVIDLYRTILTAAGIEDISSGCSFPAADDDSCDLSLYFTPPLPTPPVRPYLYSETFYPNFDPLAQGLKPGPSIGQQAIRNARWKYARSTANENWLFDLQTDPDGDNNLFPPEASSPAALALDELEDKLEQLLPGGLLSICQRKQVGESCNMPSPPPSQECCSEVCSGSVVTRQCRNPPPDDRPVCPDSTPFFE